MELMKREYGAEEVSQQSHNYLEQRKCLKASLVMRHRPDLLGELMDLEPPEGEDVEALKAFWEQVQEREKMAAEIADDIFPVDFYIYAIKCPENCMMQIGEYNCDKRGIWDVKKAEPNYKYNNRFFCRSFHWMWNICILGL